MQIVLEETRQRTLSGDMDDDDIRKLLLRAARESSDPGVRVETMDLLKGQPQSQEVRRALLHALRQDANAGVRLKALDGLRPSAGDPDVRRALADVLLRIKTRAYARKRWISLRKSVNRSWSGFSRS